MESKEDPDGEVLTFGEWTQLCVEVDRLERAMEHETEGSSSACDESHADNECKGCRHEWRDVVPGTIEAESLDHTPRVCRWTASACRRYDWSFDR